MFKWIHTSFLNVTVFVLIFLSCTLTSFGNQNEKLQEAQSLYEKALKQDTNQRVISLKKTIYLLEQIYDSLLLPDSSIQYNIGNAYFYMEDYANALLHYKKAQRWGGGTDIAFNLEQTVNKLNLSNQPLSSEFIPSLQKTITTIPLSWENLLFLTGILFLLIWCFLILYFFLKNQIIFITLWSIISLFSLHLLCLFLFQFPWLIQDQGIVIKSSSVPLQGPGKTYPTCTKNSLPLGIQLKLLSTRNNWYEVQLEEGRICWLEKNQIEKI